MNLKFCAALMSYFYAIQSLATDCAKFLCFVWPFCARDSGSGSFSVVLFPIKTDDKLREIKLRSFVRRARLPVLRISLQLVFVKKTKKTIGKQRKLKAN